MACDGSSANKRLELPDPFRVENNFPCAFAAPRAAGDSRRLAALQATEALPGGSGPAPVEALAGTRFCSACGKALPAARAPGRSRTLDAT